MNPNLADRATYTPEVLYGLRVLIAKGVEFPEEDARQVLDIALAELLIESPNRVLWIDIIVGLLKRRTLQELAADEALYDRLVVVDKTRIVSPDWMAFFLALVQERRRILGLRVEALRAKLLVMAKTVDPTGARGEGALGELERLAASDPHAAAKFGESLLNLSRDFEERIPAVMQILDRAQAALPAPPSPPGDGATPETAQPPTAPEPKPTLPQTEAALKGAPPVQVQSVNTVLHYPAGSSSSRSEPTRETPSEPPPRVSEPASTPPPALTPLESPPIAKAERPPPIVAPIAGLQRTSAEPPPKAKEPTKPADPAPSPAAPIRQPITASAPVMTQAPAFPRSTDGLAAPAPKPPKDLKALSKIGTASTPVEALTAGIAAGNAIVQVIRVIAYYGARALIAPFEMLFRAQIGERYYSGFLILLAIGIPQLLGTAQILNEIAALALTVLVALVYSLHQAACYTRDRSGGYWHSYSEGAPRFQLPAIQGHLASQYFTFDFAKLVIEPLMILCMAAAAFLFLPGPDRHQWSPLFGTMRLKADPVAIYLLVVAVAYFGYNLYCHRVRRSALLDRLDNEVLAEAMERSTQPHPAPGIFAHKGVSYSVVGKPPPEWTA